MEPVGYKVTADFEEDHWWFITRRELIFAQVRKALSDPKAEGSRRLMDFGCGTGFNLKYLAEYGEAVGADIHAETVRQFPETRNHPFVDLNGDLAEHAGRYDLVTALDVLEHIEDDTAALAQIWTFLKDGGEAVLTVPAYDWLHSGEDVISRHKRRYTLGRLRAAIAKTGFDIRFASYFNLAILPPAAAHIWWRRMLHPDWDKESNLARPSRILNALLIGITGFENRLIGNELISLPAGASIVCRLRKNAA